MARLFTTKIANYYEEYYKSRGVNFVKGTVLSSFDFDSNGKVLKLFFEHFLACDVCVDTGKGNLLS